MLEQRSLSGWPARGTSGLRARYAPPLGINSSPAIHRASPCRAIHRPAAAASTLRSRLVATRATGNWPAPFSAHSPRKTTWPWLTRWPSTSDSWGRPALSHRSAGVAPHRRLRRTAGCSSRSRSGWHAVEVWRCTKVCATTSEQVSGRDVYCLFTQIPENTTSHPRLLGTLRPAHRRSPQ
jgi:hypothetical protein